MQAGDTIHKRVLHYANAEIQTLYQDYGITGDGYDEAQAENSRRQYGDNILDGRAADTTIYRLCQDHPLQRNGTPQQNDYPVRARHRFLGGNGCCGRDCHCDECDILGNDPPGHLIAYSGGFYEGWGFLGFDGGTETTNCERYNESAKKITNST